MAFYATGKGHGLSITPLPAGHMIGGTIWKIVKDGEEEIVYAVDFNHKREMWVKVFFSLYLWLLCIDKVLILDFCCSFLSHLNGCTLESISRPSLLITDSFNATYVQPRRKQRDEMLLSKLFLWHSTVFCWIVSPFLNISVWSLCFSQVSWMWQFFAHFCSAVYVEFDRAVEIICLICDILFLTANVMETLRGDGNVLIAVDTAGRVLELAQLLDQIWRTKDAGLGVYPLALLNNVSYNVVEFSKSQVLICGVPNCKELVTCFQVSGSTYKITYEQFNPLPVGGVDEW